MKVMSLVAALLLALPFATLASTHARAGQRSDRAHPGISRRLPGYGIEGRQVAAPPWSAACTNDTGSTQCDEPMWVYGSPDYVAQFRSAF
jgi:hypothetical protein